MKLPSRDAMARHADERISGPQIRLPRREVERPLRQVGKRLLMALGVLVVTVLIVYVDREGYHDNANETLDFLDCAYYATVTLSTTGYGDIVPYSDSARLVNILVITPLRVLFPVSYTHLTLPTICSV